MSRQADLLEAYHNILYVFIADGRIIDLIRPNFILEDLL